MSTEPEALRLADALERDIYRVVGEKPTQDAAAELRRLYAEVERLTTHLKKANDQAERFEREWYLRGDTIEDMIGVLKGFSDYVRDEQCSTDGAVTYSTTTVNHWAFLARDAIAKATGEKS